MNTVETEYIKVKQNAYRWNRKHTGENWNRINTGETESIQVKQNTRRVLHNTYRGNRIQTVKTEYIQVKQNTYMWNRIVKCCS